MRQMETRIRQQKDVANAARASGDDVLRRKAQRKIVDLNAKYQEVADKSGLKPKLDRTFVRGFRDVKLKNGGESDTITSEELRSKLGAPETGLGTLPNAISAATIQDKLQRYLLNSNHPAGKEMPVFSTASWVITMRTGTFFRIKYTKRSK